MVLLSITHNLRPKDEAELDVCQWCKSFDRLGRRRREPSPSGDHVSPPMMVSRSKDFHKI